MKNSRFPSARLFAAALTFAGLSALASSHREAPFITSMPKTDGTDFYMFRSYEAGRDSFVTFIANYLPLQDAYGGPNYFTLDPEALYEIHIDNDVPDSGVPSEDLTFQFRFQNTLSNSGVGIQLPIGADAGTPKNIAIPYFNAGDLRNPANLSVQQTYGIKVVRGDRRTGTAQDVTRVGGGASFDKPVDYIGTKSVDGGSNSDEAYAAYAQSKVYDIAVPGCATNGRVFVGQRAEGFAVNLGPVFDLVNAPASVITDNAARGAVPNPLADKNVTSIALELPINCVTVSGKPIIGAWTTASVRQARALNPAAPYARPAKNGGAWQQVSRLGHPLVNEVVIGIKDKDLFNAVHPTADPAVIDYVTHPALPELLFKLFGVVPPPPPRNDLVQVFLKGVPGVNENGAVAEYLRLNTALPVTLFAVQNPLGAAGCFVNDPNASAPTRMLSLPPSLGGTNVNCDPAGFPNGRRPIDDVTDIALRVAMGYLYNSSTVAPARDIPFHDGVAQEATPFLEGAGGLPIFPYLNTPNRGANGDGT